MSGGERHTQSAGGTSSQATHRPMQLQRVGVVGQETNSWRACLAEAGRPSPSNAHEMSRSSKEWTDRGRRLGMATAENARLERPVSHGRRRRGLASPPRWATTTRQPNFAGGRTLAALLLPATAQRPGHLTMTLPASAPGKIAPVVALVGCAHPHAAEAKPHAQALAGMPGRWRGGPFGGHPWSKDCFYMTQSLGCAASGQRVLAGPAGAFAFGGGSAAMPSSALSLSPAPVASPALRCPATGQSTGEAGPWRPLRTRLLPVGSRLRRPRRCPRVRVPRTRAVRRTGAMYRPPGWRIPVATATPPHTNPRPLRPMSRWPAAVDQFPSRLSHRSNRIASPSGRCIVRTDAAGGTRRGTVLE